MKFVFATTAALATLALGQQHLLSLETTHHTEYWNIPHGGVHQYGSIPPGGGHLTIYRQDGHIEYVNHLKVTQLSGEPFCVQTTEDGGDLTDWSTPVRLH